MDTRRYQVAPAQLAGGFGSVVEVHDRYLDRDVLYKRMHDSANNAQLLTEVTALTRVRSKHIIEIYDLDFDQNGQLIGIIIEKLGGRDYSGFHNEAAQNPDAYLKVVYQIACALADLHSVDIVHRDLKLDNFKASQAGIVKLFDFGISSIEGTRHTLQNRGTLLYAGPELYVPGAVVTRASDMYSLGVCCWMLATPSIPAELCTRPPQGLGRAPSILTAAPYVDQDLAQMIDACLEPDPSRRPSALEFKEKCETLLLKGKHRGLFFNSKRPIFELSTQSPTIRIQIASLGELRAAYTGTRFSVTGVSGDVFINNTPATVGAELFDACVVTFGNFAAGRDRQYISFFCSKPEIVL